MSESYSVIVIGAGCAGLTAAIYLARAELKPLVFAGDLENKGGLLTKTSIVENYPGFAEGIDGNRLMDQMEKQAIKYGAQIIDNKIVKVNFQTRPFWLEDDEHRQYYAQSVIIATGSQPQKLDLVNEEKFWANGISSCAVCDGALFKGRKIIVVGGGDTACEHALFLTKFSPVTMLLRRDQFRASKIMQQRVLSHPQIKVIYNTIVKSLIGHHCLEAIECQNVTDGNNLKLSVDGLFYGLGLKPQTEIFLDQLAMDESGYIIKGASERYLTMTSVEGIFVAGDCSDKRYLQAITAAAEGCQAAIDCIDYLMTNNSY